MVNCHPINHASLKTWFQFRYQDAHTTEERIIKQRTFVSDREEDFVRAVEIRQAESLYGRTNRLGFGLEPLPRTTELMGC